MAMCFVLAVATHLEVALAGQRREQLDGVAVLRSSHFSPVLLDELGPLRRCLGLLAELHGLDARREVGKPHVVPVL
jgi:hypothetical protein